MQETSTTQPAAPASKHLPPEVQHLMTVVMTILLVLVGVMVLVGSIGIIRALRRHRERVRLMREHQEMPINAGPDPWKVSAERLQVNPDDKDDDEDDDDPSPGHGKKPPT